MYLTGIKQRSYSKPIVRDYLISDKLSKMHTGGKSASNKWCWKNCFSTGTRTTRYLSLTSHENQFKVEQRP